VVILIVYIFLMIIFLIILSEIECDIAFHRIKDDDNIKVEVKMFFGLIKFNLVISYLDMIVNKRFKIGFNAKGKLRTKKEAAGKRKVFNIDEIKGIYHKSRLLIRKYKKSFEYILSKINLDSLSWETELGLEDAALTAICAGALWSVKYNILSAISQRSRPQKTYINVIPNYSNIIFEMNLNCIIRVRIANIIITAIRLVFLSLVYHISENGSERNERTPDSGANENHNG
jgi:hypothetical protein